MKAHGYAFAMAVMVIAAMTSCKGRTADNVVPTGDTVEVNIDSTEIIVSEAPDTVAADTTVADAKAADEMDSKLFDIEYPTPRHDHR